MKGELMSLGLESVLKFFNKCFFVSSSYIFAGFSFFVTFFNIKGQKNRSFIRRSFLLFSCGIIPCQPKKLINFAGHFWKQ
ncbi:hypothetical protein C4H11_02695 [Bacteroides zoogleoformans]|uniref:Uncharacterized protein n=1 Tax=Bacteroides zoogleoformans TaxID=28119 RepID=A0ABN5IH18_9BACE|nr:hypothetical protein C4H11_02695 [Bacteroides zoogleoformans]